MSQNRRLRAVQQTRKKKCLTVWAVTQIRSALLSLRFVLFIRGAEQAETLL